MTGSTKAKTGRKLVRVRDGFNTSTLSAYLADWRPTGTTNAGSCYQMSLSLGLGAYGISASVGSNFLVCPETFGPSFIGSRLFRFRWEGKRSAGSWVGAGGGALYAVPAGVSAKFSVGVVAWYCKTSESGC